MSAKHLSYLMLIAENCLSVSVRCIYTCIWKWYFKSFPIHLTHTHTHTQTKDYVLIDSVEDGGSSRQRQIMTDEALARELQEQFNREALVTHVPPTPHIWSARGVSWDSFLSALFLPLIFSFPLIHIMLCVCTACVHFKFSLLSLGNQLWVLLSIPL